MEESPLAGQGPIVSGSPQLRLSLLIHQAIFWPTHHRSPRSRGQPEPAGGASHQLERSVPVTMVDPAMFQAMIAFGMGGRGLASAGQPGV